MEIRVTEGQNIIKILWDGFADCLIIEKALTVNWPDCAGSVGEYYALSNHPSELREQLTCELNEVLINGNESQILRAIKPFLNLFLNGDYSIGFFETDLTTTLFHQDDTIEYADWVPEDARFSGWLYAPDHENYFFTVPKTGINLKRVSYYTKLIENGARPKILVFSSYDEATFDSSMIYVLDGHHKVIAYLQLGINIPCVSITKLENKTHRNGEILLAAHPVLKDFEFYHFFINNENILNVDFQSEPSLAKMLDDVLLNSKRIDTSIVSLFIKKLESGNQIDREWVDERVRVLSKNKFTGRGLHLYYKIFNKQYNQVTWTSIEITNKRKFKEWIALVLKIEPA